MIGKVCISTYRKINFLSQTSMEQIKNIWNDTIIFLLQDNEDKVADYL